MRIGTWSSSSSVGNIRLASSVTRAEILCSQRCVRSSRLSRRRVASIGASGHSMGVDVESLPPFKIPKDLGADHNERADLRADPKADLGADLTADAHDPCL